MDQLSKIYQPLLDGTYECLDRIVLNAYFRLGHDAGGFRVWWRRLTGSEETLDNAHLIRMAGRFGRRLRAWARDNGIPLKECRPGEDKHEIGEAFLQATPVRRGIFLVLVSRAQAPVWDIHPNRRITRKAPMPYVNHYHFHILDEEWGHVTFKLSAHPPFPAQIILNGHEYLYRQALKASIQVNKEGNSFNAISNLAAFSPIADTLAGESAMGRLAAVCRRWIYTCVDCALDAKERERSGFRYQFSVYQFEYCRNLLFRQGSAMVQVLEGLVDRNRVRMNVDTVKTIIGRKTRPYATKKRKAKQWQVTVERPSYDLTIFKVHCGKLGFKIYSKGERVLRVEAMARNASALKCGRALENFVAMLERLKTMLERFIESLCCMDQCSVSNLDFAALPEPSLVGTTRVGGVDFNRRRLWLVAQSLLALSISPRGFTASQFARHVCVHANEGFEYSARQAAYDMKKLRGKGMIRLIGKSRRYEPTQHGLSTISALWLLREKVIGPLIAVNAVPEAASERSSVLDGHYRALRVEMQGALRELGLAA